MLMLYRVSRFCNLVSSCPVVIPKVSNQGSSIDKNTILREKSATFFEHWPKNSVESLAIPTLPAFLLSVFLDMYGRQVYSVGNIRAKDDE
jgi:hypothetical protein